MQSLSEFERHFMQKYSKYPKICTASLETPSYNPEPQEQSWKPSTP